jgi:putative toxin-antitoxin system antitoxin component (TIGR02293 family)
MAIAEESARRVPRVVKNRPTPKKTVGAVKRNADGAEILPHNPVSSATLASKLSEQRVEYRVGKGVDDFVMKVHLATPLQLVNTERVGVPGQFFKALSLRMAVPTTRLYSMLGVAKATAEKKAANGEILSGTGGHAAIGMAKLLGIARALADSSTAREAKGFDSAKWLGQWLERPQPALGGRRAADFLDTPTGVEVVGKLLGAIESGAYQ